MLLHGFTGTSSTWKDLADRLEKESFVIVPHLPGHGRSGFSTSKTKMSLESTSDSLVKLMDDLGVRKVALVGYSLGGRVALNLALRHPERVDSLVIEGASPGIRSDFERKDRRLSDDALADEMEVHDLAWFVDRWEKTPLLSTQRTVDKGTARRLRQERMSNDKRGLAMSLRGAGSGRMRPLWGDLASLDVPVLVVVGEKDQKFREVAKSMADLIPGGAVRVVKGSGHAAHLEKPKEFGEVVGAFLSAGKKAPGRVSR